MTSRIILLVALFFTSCSPEKEKKDAVLPPEKMQSVLWDVIEADVYTFTAARFDSSANPSRENALLQETIFRNHGVSRKEYYNSLDYYLAHSEQFIPMLDSVMAQHPALSPPLRKQERWNRDSLRLQAQ